MSEPTVRSNNFEKPVDVVVLTDHRYVAPEATDTYTKNVLLEDQLVTEALRENGLTVERRSWDDADFNWDSARILLFRTTWDYFDRFGEFEPWLRKVSRSCRLLNPAEVIFWNLDKHYLRDLAKNGVNIAPTVFIDKGEQPELSQILRDQGWKEMVFKPCISGAGRHTYRVSSDNAPQMQTLLHELLEKESFMMQEFQHHVVTRGEISVMIINGKYTHAVLKTARSGEFRVQDDFGGTVTPYDPSPEEIAFAEHCVRASGFDLVYARVDIFTDNQGALALAELELIEPELWFRNHRQAAHRLAEAISALCTEPT